MKLVIPQEVEEKIHAYAMSVDSEIAGMGKVRVEGESIIVEDVMIVEQEVTGATADLSTQAMAKWMGELIKNGGSPKDWKLWFHSHDNMQAFFSKRDTDTMDRHNESDWLVSLVVNKRREREARLDVYRPFRLKCEDMEIEVLGASTFVVPEAIKQEVARKVKTKKYTATAPAPTTGYGYATPSPYRSADDYDDEETAGSGGVGYTKAQVIGIIKTLEKQRSEALDLYGTESRKYQEISAELPDWYFTLADMETEDYELASKLREQADVIEGELYGVRAEEDNFHV